MLSLPKDVIRLLHGYLLPRQRPVFAQVCVYIRSCSTLNERLTWAAGPPDPSMRIELEVFAHRVHPCFEFNFRNFCVHCLEECPKRPKHECPYLCKNQCMTCKKVTDLWLFAPWRMKNDAPLYHSRFGLCCKVCGDPVNMHACIRSCQKCRDFCCYDCIIGKCPDCNLAIYGRKGLPLDHDCDTSVGRWIKLIKSRSGNMVESCPIETSGRLDPDAVSCSDSIARFVRVAFRKETSVTTLEIWAIGHVMSLTNIAKLFGHAKSDQAKEVAENVDFIFYVDDEPKRGVPLDQQIIKRVTLKDYLDVLK